MSLATNHPNTISPPASSTFTTLPSRYFPPRMATDSGFLQLVLNHPLKRTRAIGWVIARMRQMRLGAVTHFQRDLTISQQFAQPTELDIHDLRQMCIRQAVEHHDLVNAIQELWSEEALQLARDVIALKRL